MACILFRLCLWRLWTQMEVLCSRGCHDNQRVLRRRSRGPCLLLHEDKREVRHYGFDFCCSWLTRFGDGWLCSVSSVGGYCHWWGWRGTRLFWHSFLWLASYWWPCWGDVCPRYGNVNSITIALLQSREWISLCPVGLAAFWGVVAIGLFADGENLLSLTHGRPGLFKGNLTTSFVYKYGLLNLLNYFVCRRWRLSPGSPIARCRLLLRLVNGGHFHSSLGESCFNYPR